MLCRPRRNRASEAARRLVRENALTTSDLVMPLFIEDGAGIKTEIATMPGIFRYSLDTLLAFCEKLTEAGVCGIALFPKVKDELKDKSASISHDPSCFYLQAVSKLKSTFPNLQVFTDVAMDPYSSDGHDGVVSPDGRILNDETLPVLARMAVAQAEAGADFVAPSDMMDGRVEFIRRALDEHSFTSTGILSYTAKYASAFYGPFRDALDSAPSFGDKKTYQMDPANSREALLEARLDEAEGADMLMVKPGLPYLDIVRELRANTLLPIAIYNVSGEYAALKFAAKAGALDYQQCVLETLLSMKRAGASVIFTYHAFEVANWLRETG